MCDAQKRARAWEWRGRPLEGAVSECEASTCATWLAFDRESCVLCLGVYVGVGPQASSSRRGGWGVWGGRGASDVLHGAVGVHTIQITEEQTRVRQELKSD